jgi:hypothetical protein
MRFRKILRSLVFLETGVQVGPNGALIRHVLKVSSLERIETPSMLQSNSPPFGGSSP